MDREVKPIRTLFDHFAINGIALVTAEGDEPAAAFFCVLERFFGVFGIHIDAAGAAAIENFELGGVIVREIRMLNGADVIGADIQKSAHVKGHPAHAPDLERL